MVKKIDHRYPKKFRYVLKSKKSIFELIWTTKNTTFFQPGPAGVGYRLCPPLLLSPPSFERCKHNSACKVSVRYHSRFFVFVWHETMYATVGNHHFFTIPCHGQTYQNYFRTSVKPVHKCYLCTGFTEVLNNGRPGDDMF